MNLQSNLKSQVSIWSFFLILAALAILLLLSAAGQLIEDLQTLLFLPLLLAFWRLPKNPSYRIPGPLILTVLILWLGASLRVHGVFNKPSSRTAVYLSRFPGDKDGLLGRSTFQRYNEIAQTYHLPSMELLLRTLSTEKETRLWLSGNPNVPLVVGGDSEHFDITFNNIIDSQAHCFRAALAQDSLSSSQRKAAQDLGIDLERDVLSVRIPGLERPLLLTMQPLRVKIPDEPSELSRHFMAWLAAGLAKKPHDVLESPESPADRLSRWQDAFNEALKIDGPWGTPIPAGLSYYMIGTLQTLEALTQAQPHPVTIQRGGVHF